jgi:hypothetical protein
MPSSKTQPTAFSGLSRYAFGPLDAHGGRHRRGQRKVCYVLYGFLEEQ